MTMSSYPVSRAAEPDSAFPLRRHNIAQQENVLSIRLQQETTMNTWTSCLLLALGTAEHGGPLTPRVPRAVSSSCHRTSPTKDFPERRNTSTLFGDSSQPGFYVDCIRFPPGMKVMPHWHPDTVRTVLVMSGTFYFAVGEQWDESRLKAYPAGTLYSEPAKTPHFAWAKDGEVILQVTAIGPTGNTPIPQKQ